ncbi:aspartate/glutamate racemase family protein [Thermophagus sp. OGC60D27]|uniref:aspartate/glutamate racemase family protein n=1 Tax=Thermophagus sp. OGC60D27 TaxID=3458415 RepID=UPI004037B902
MKKIGLIGGLGPESTVEYYRGIIDEFKVINDGSLNYPDIIIYSVNISKFIGLVSAGENHQAIDYLLTKLHMLEKAEPDFLALTANTPHLFFNELQKKVSLPLVSIVEATAAEAQRLKLRKPALLGTAVTMNYPFFDELFKTMGMRVVVPGEADKKYLNQKLFSEIELGIFKEETREGILTIIDRMKQTDDIDGIILGCTELPLILPQNAYRGLPVLNTTQLHIKEIVKRSIHG